MLKTSLMCPVALLVLATAWATATAEVAPNAGRSSLPPAVIPQRPSEPQGEEGRLYSDTFLPLRDDVRAFEQDPANRYAYCIRSTATYECPSYASDGSLRRRQHKKTAYGTGFAYQIDGEQTRLLTNEHVVYWPFVTDSEHALEDVPFGCKRISRKLQIVDNEDDEYEADDIALDLLVEDRALDAAVVRAKGKLRLLPYRIGKSSALSTGDVVIVRGFPLGVFAAYNTGKIINTLDVDDYKHWNHKDFIVDAQLSSGNSGSPVLALHRRTGEYELVGMFHASYTRASSLNAVTTIDELRELMFDLKRSARSEAGLGNELPLSEPEMRSRLLAALADPDFVPFVSLGSLIVRLHESGQRLLFEVFSKGFPLNDHRLALFLDEPAEGGRGKLRRVWVGNERGYRAYAMTDLDASSAGLLKRVLQRLYVVSNSALAYRKLMSRVPDSREAVQKRAVLARSLSRTDTQDSDAAQQLLEFAQDKAPATTEAALSLGEVRAQMQRSTDLPATPVAQAKPSSN